MARSVRHMGLSRLVTTSFEMHQIISVNAGIQKEVLMLQEFREGRVHALMHHPSGCRCEGKSLLRLPFFCEIKLLSLPEV